MTKEMKGGYNKIQTKHMVEAMLKKQKKAENITKEISPKSCPTGTVRRTAHIRRSSSGKEAIIPAKCIKATGKRDKIPGLFDPKTGERIYIIIEKGVLGSFGYKDLKTKSLKERRNALKRVYEKYNGNWLSLFRKLNYIATLNKNKDPELYNILISDRDFIKKTFSGPV